MRQGTGIVLCRVEGAINVGASCRAMKSMGFSRLILASCPEFDEVDVRTHALHAFDVYQRAERHASLREALSTFPYAAGFTRRAGRRRKEAVAVDSFAGSLAEGARDEVALVFGNERDGLDDAELSLCDDAVYIPSSELFPSLNLSHAVQVACWELRRAALPSAFGPLFTRDCASGADRATHSAREGRIPADRATQEACVGRMTDALEAVGFFKLVGPGDMATFLRSVAARASLSEVELKRLTAVFEKMGGLTADRRRPPRV